MHARRTERRRLRQRWGTMQSTTNTEETGSARRNDSVTEDIPAERIATSPRTGLMGTFLTVVRTGIDEGHDGRTDDDTRAEQTQR